MLPRSGSRDCSGSDVGGSNKEPQEGICITTLAPNHRPIRLVGACTRSSIFAVWSMPILTPGSCPLGPPMASILKIPCTG
jgi:hypothetical protein